MSLDDLRQLGGTPGEGIHRYRIGPFALVDTVVTILVSLILWHYFAPPCWGNGRLVIFICFVLVLSLVVHKMVGVNTAGVQIFDSWWNGTPGYTTSDSSGSMSPSFNSPRTRMFQSDDLNAFSSGEPSVIQVAGPGQDTDKYYPLARDNWRAAPVNEQYQDFSQI
jgi:hypothetical protein